MRQRCCRGVGCSREERWHRGGRCGGKLGNVSTSSVECGKWYFHTQWLLLEEKEASVNQLEVLGEVVELVGVRTCGILGSYVSKTHVVQNNKLVGPATLVSADGVEDTSSHESGKQLLDEKQQKYATDGGQVKVVDLEEAVELKGLTSTHDLSATQNNDVVGDQHGGSGAEGGHEGLSLNESEVLRLVALDGFEGLFKDGPQLKTERTVESGNAIADPA